MGEAEVLVESTVAEARAKAKAVREQLRVLAATLNELETQTLDLPAGAAGRLSRAQVNVTRAVQELNCTDGGFGPF